MTFIDNGKYKYPGCNYIEYEDKYGKKHLFDICGSNMIQLKPGMKVHRHLMNGDKILFNRQPSLHKLNMMCHSVSIIENSYYHDKLSTFRLNTSATEPYNADFDGDEMNLHAPQTTKSKVEIDILTNLKYHIISPKYASPVISLKQDSLMGVYLFTRYDHNYSLFEVSLFLSNIRMTTNIFKNINKFSKTKKSISNKDIVSVLFDPLFYKNESQNVLIENGTMKSGVFKKNCWKFQNNLIHSFYKTYEDKQHAVDSIDNLQILSNNFILYFYGFTIGFSDFLIPEKKKMNYILKECKKSKIWNHY